MAYRTKYGKHYHETFGCHGATIPCDTKGLSPCSDCCGGKGGDSATDSGIAGGAPSTGSQGPTTESMEAASRWRRGATNALFGGNIDLGAVKNRGKGMTYDEWKAQQQTDEKADEELDAMMAAAESPDYDFDEMADDAFPFGDGGKYSLYGSSDSFPDDGDWDSYYAEASETIATAGTDGLTGGMDAPTPDDITRDAVVKSLDGTEPIGTTSKDWDRQTRTVAELAGIPESSDGRPTRLMGRVGSLYVFETNSKSTSNPNDSSDHFGEWLYDVRTAHVIAPDGTDLSGAIKVARNLRRSMGAERERFERRCRGEALSIAQKHRLEVHEHEVETSLLDARAEYERDVIESWKRGYEEWRTNNDARAQRMAEDMRRNRPEHRHRYIEGDVEERMQRAYARKHPRPEPWNYTLPQYQRAVDDAHEFADQMLDDEGWDEDAEYEKAMRDVLARRDPDGLRGVSPRMRQNYDTVMTELETWPEIEQLMDMRMQWGATLGMPVKTPDAWRKQFA